MCGINGIAAGSGHAPSVNDETFLRLRDRLAHRGPDGAGMFRDDQVLLGHRRLAIIDPAHGEQPWIVRGDDGAVRLALTFNGEIYNHRAVRQELEAEGRRFTTQCDTETLAVALDHWGSAALARVRGMFALAAWQPQDRQLVLARDPLGIKPLYYGFADTPAGRELVFASEPLAILDHPSWTTTPDWGVVSSYLTTIRTTLDTRTMFGGMHTVRPGEVLEISCAGSTPRVIHQSVHHPTAGADLAALDDDALAATTRDVITESVHAHLMSDRPLATLLSGGLDSSIITALAVNAVPELRSWCIGDPEADPNGDLAHAGRTASWLGTQHANVAIDAAAFAERWPWMIRRLGVPVGTPNEIAIHAVAELLGRDARVVLSGEGADELFGGYDVPLTLASQWIDAAHAGHDVPAIDAFYLSLVSWIETDHKAHVLTPAITRATDDDSALRAMIRTTYAQCGDVLDLATHRRVQQRLNLTGLLARLDTATMLASVEGRTPFADIEVARFAESIAVARNFSPASDGAGGVAVAAPARTKAMLRRAFDTALPPDIAARPKASFPLPFQSWMATLPPDVLLRGPITEVVRAETRLAIAQDPEAHWRYAWPVFNLALWLDAIFG